MNPPAPDQPRFQPDDPHRPIQPDLFTDSAGPSSPAIDPSSPAAPAVGSESGLSRSPLAEPEAPDPVAPDPAPLPGSADRGEEAAGFDLEMDLEFCEDPDLADWKQSLRTCFEAWLARIQDIPEPDPDVPAGRRRSRRHSSGAPLAPPRPSEPIEPALARLRLRPKKPVCNSLALGFGHGNWQSTPR